MDLEAENYPTAWTEISPENGNRCRRIGLLMGRIQSNNQLMKKDGRGI